MKHLSATTLLLFLLSCSIHPKKLDGKTQTVEFHYIMWACECANWATPGDIYRYQDTGDLSEHCVYIEPADSSLILPDTVGCNLDIVQFTGQYYVDKGLPNIKTEQQVDKAKIFRYTAYKIIKSNYRKSLADLIDSAKYLVDKGKLTGQTQTIDVSYAVIGCTCPQWFETKNVQDDSVNGRQYFYLEPASSNLISADTLFNGTNIPIRLLLSGQYYSNKGYPANYFPAKGDPEPSKVFRYNKIKVIENGKRAMKSKG